MEGQSNQRSKVQRTIAAAVILGFAVPFVPWLIARLVISDPVDDSQQEVGLMAWLASLVAVGIIAGVGAAMIAGTDDRRRRTGAVVLCATMTAAAALGGFAGDLLFIEDLVVGIGSLVVVSVMTAAIPVTLGTLLGYAIGREWRRGRRPSGAG